MRRYLLRAKTLPKLIIMFASRTWYRFFPVDIYRSIDDLCIFYWDRIHETGNYSYLVRSKSTHIHKKKPGFFRGYWLGLKWRELEEQYIARFGFSQNFLNIIRKEKELLKLKAERISNQDKTLNIFINIIQDEITAMKTDKGGSNFYESKAYVEKGMGFRIDPLHTSVSEFYSYIEVIKKQAPQKKAK